MLAVVWCRGCFWRRVDVVQRARVTLWGGCLRRITFKRDTKVENACTFKVFREDHTLGNLLCQYVFMDVMPVATQFDGRICVM